MSKVPVTVSATERARWSVMWIAKGKRGMKVVERDCEDDFNEALRLYVLAKKADKPMATLRCKNVGFPPPDKYADKGVEIVRRKGKRYKRRYLIEPRRYEKTMGEYNARGIWWCPYCRELRRFMQRDGVRYEGIYIEGAVYYCPLCEIPHTNFHVRLYNPRARILAITVTKPRRSSGRRRRG